MPQGTFIVPRHQHQRIKAVMSILRKPPTKKTDYVCWAAIASLVTLGFVAATKPASAFGVTYNFTVQINSDTYEAQGLPNGKIEQGSFTYSDENLVGIGNEYASKLKGNLSLQFNFLNQTYTEKDDLNYGNTSYLYDYPAAFFLDGALLGLDFLVVPSQLQPPQNALGFRIFNDAFFVGATDNFNSGTQVGTVTYSPVTDSGPSGVGGGVAAVPEPSEVGGAIVAFSALGVWMRKAKGRR